MREPPPPSPARTWATRIVGWIYLAFGAAFLAGWLGSVLSTATDPTSARRTGEWSPIVLPFLALFPITFAFAGYRALRHPPLHRRRTLLAGFVVLVGAWLALYQAHR